MVDMGIDPQDQVLHDQSGTVHRRLKGDLPGLGDRFDITTFKGQQGLPVEVSKGDGVPGNPGVVLKPVLLHAEFHSSGDVQVSRYKDGPPISPIIKDLLQLGKSLDGIFYGLEGRLDYCEDR